MQGNLDGNWKNLLQSRSSVITMYTHHTNFQRRCRFLCDVCHSGFMQERDMRRHKRTVRCVAAPAPRVDFQDFLHENWANLLHKRTVDRDKLSHDLRQFIHENWTTVRRHVVKGLATVDLKEKVEKSAESELWQELYDKKSHDLQDFIHARKLGRRTQACDQGSRDWICTKMLIGHFRWIGLLPKVWCSHHRECREKVRNWVLHFN